jgi:hypothetical protein
MKSEFITELVVSLIREKEDGSCIWKLHEPLIYHSKLLNGALIAEPGFYTDFASVPRLPVVYRKWGNRAHKEATIHDLTYCKNVIYIMDGGGKSLPGSIPFDLCNEIFLEAMEAQNKPMDIRIPMYEGVCLGGKSHYHKRFVEDKLI